MTKYIIFTAVPAQTLLNHRNVFLKLDGVDTAAQVTLNRKTLGATDNMFITYMFNATQALQSPSGQNQDTFPIELFFMSPVLYAQQQASLPTVRSRTDPGPYPAPPACPPAEQHGECHVNYIRKEQCSFAWDWGPAFPTVGLWRSASLHAFDVSRVDYVRVNSRPANAGQYEGDWIVKAFAGLQLGCDARSALVEQKASLVLRATIRFDGAEVARSQLPIDAEKLRDECLGEAEFEFLDSTIRKPRLWWPNGYGEQPLYELEVSAHVCYKPSEEKDCELHDVKLVRFGLREISLVQKPLSNSDSDSNSNFDLDLNGASDNALKRSPDDRRDVHFMDAPSGPGAGSGAQAQSSDAGLSFYFVVNGVAIYAKGSNWIPPSVHPSSSGMGFVFPGFGTFPDFGVVQMRSLLENAAVAHMNMLRSWGGGIYESDAFYEAADEFGVLCSVHVRPLSVRRTAALRERVQHILRIT